MNVYVAEFLGTALLVLLGNGVVANVLLKQTKGHQAGWIVITAGWGLAVFVAVACVDAFSGAHINPAVTLGLAVARRFSWSLVPGYLLGQFFGGLLGAMIVYAVYRLHYEATDDADAKLATFCTAPAIRSWRSNLLSEIVGTFVLVLTVLLFVAPQVHLPPDESSVPLGLGAVGAVPVGLLVFSIGLSLGGTTGYAINPARDLSPRLAHQFLPIAGKRDSDWAYGWVPVVGPLVGALLAAIVARSVA